MSPRKSSPGRPAKSSTCSVRMTCMKPSWKGGSANTAAVALFERLYRPGFHYQKCGAMLTDLSPAAYSPRDLFDTRDHARQARLMHALDAMNADYGARSVHVGNLGGRRPTWVMRQAFRSPRYTTRWAELPLVRYSDPAK
jgi:DNA polymerase V